MFDTRTAKAALAALGLVAATAAVPPAGLAQEATFDDAKVEAFVTARLEVEEIRTSYVEQLETAATEQERLELSQQANEEMLAAVEEAPGITIVEYNAIVDAAGSDPDLVERVNEKMMQAEQ